MLGVWHAPERSKAQVPFSMMMLLDHVKTKKDIPPEMKCRQVLPFQGNSGVCMNTVRRTVLYRTTYALLIQICHFEKEFQTPFPLNYL